MPDEPSHLDKSRAAYRDLGVDDDDEEGFIASVRRVAAHRPKNDPEPEKLK